MIAVGTFSAYVLESDNADSRIRDLGDAYWLALATITTIGYGDVAPVTALGRAVGAFLIKTAAPNDHRRSQRSNQEKSRQHRKPHTGRSRGTTPDDQALNSRKQI
ncbi:MAG: potassium channel family protein [Candidatus Caldarchaeales archaeon]|nr:potassium channel family protein [Candidatus Caldarchaeales archaeon]